MSLIANPLLLVRMLSSVILVDDGDGRVSCFGYFLVVSGWSW